MAGLFRDRQTRRKLALLGVVLAIVFIIGVFWSVLVGEAEWWTLVLLLPALAIMRRLYQYQGRLRDRRKP